MMTWQELETAEEFFWSEHKRFVALCDVHSCRQAGDALLEKYGLYFHEIRMHKERITKNACKLVRRIIGKGRTSVDNNGVYMMYGDKNFDEVLATMEKRYTKEATIKELAIWHVYRLPCGLCVQLRKVNDGIFATFP